MFVRRKIIKERERQNATLLTRGIRPLHANLFNFTLGIEERKLRRKINPEISMSRSWIYDGNLEQLLLLYYF
jgi:hypothetical protein